MAQTVADHMLERLRQWDVEYVFGYPGDGINAIMGAFGRAGDKPRFIQSRHEEMSAFEAVGYAKFTDKVGVCLATYDDRGRSPAGGRDPDRAVDEVGELLRDARDLDEVAGHVLEESEQVDLLLVRPTDGAAFGRPRSPRPGRGRPWASYKPLSRWMAPGPEAQDRTRYCSSAPGWRSAAGVEELCHLPNVDALDPDLLRRCEPDRTDAPISRPAACNPVTPSTMASAGATSRAA
ncbi:MAG: thiamine pyrophosphate-binding protein [Nocardioidaceae bacterium]